jgi:hypothetical protein
MGWIYRGEEFADPKDYVGFVYLIENLKTGQKYIGKKLFTMAGTRQIKGKKKRIRKPSDWQNYWSSSASVALAILNEGEDNFRRTILHLCRTKAECSYYESYEIFLQQALIDPSYYNDWVSCRIRKAHLTKLQLPIDRLFLS